MYQAPGTPSVMEIKIRLSLPHDEISIPIVRRICTESLRALGVSQDCIDDVELALTEACANVLLHARADDEYTVSVGVENDVAAIEIVDHGCGFEPSENLEVLAAGQMISIPDRMGPGEEILIVDGYETLAADAIPEQGRGILLMRALMDRVRFQTGEGPHRGTRVQLEKTLQWDEGALGARLARTTRDLSGASGLPNASWNGHPRRGDSRPGRSPDGTTPGEGTPEGNPSGTAGSRS